MGSASDEPVMAAAAQVLAELGVPVRLRVVSAHRTPLGMVEYGRQAAGRGVRVIIAGAGGAAHLPGMLASLTTLPVIGVPVALRHLDGLDSLLSIVQMRTACLWPLWALTPHAMRACWRHVSWPRRTPDWQNAWQCTHRGWQRLPVVRTRSSARPRGRSGAHPVSGAGWAAQLHSQACPCVEAGPRPGSIPSTVVVGARPQEGRTVLPSNHLTVPRGRANDNIRRDNKRGGATAGGEQRLLHHGTRWPCRRQHVTARPWCCSTGSGPARSTPGPVTRRGGERSLGQRVPRSCSRQAGPQRSQSPLSTVAACTNQPEGVR